MEAYWKNLLAQDVVAGCTPLPHALPLPSAVFTVPSHRRGEHRGCSLGKDIFPCSCIGGVTGSEQSVTCGLHVAGIIKTAPLLQHSRQSVTEMDLPLARSPAQPRLKPKQKKTPSVVCNQGCEHRPRSCTSHTRQAKLHRDNKSSITPSAD